jgi:hypothetical protein
MTGSEVTRLLQRIREENEAAQRGLEGYATVSKHTFITARMEKVDGYVDQLVKVTGSEEAAMQLLIADQNQAAGSTITHATP